MSASIPTEAMTKDWVIRKNGYFYRQNRAGYAASVVEAGRFTEAEAKAEATVEGSITAHHITEFAPSMKDEYERLASLSNWLRDYADDLGPYESRHLMAASQAIAEQCATISLSAGASGKQERSVEIMPTEGVVTITTNAAGECMAVTRCDTEGRILKIIWERRAPIPCAGVGSGYISQDRLENDDGSSGEPSALPEDYDLVVSTLEVIATDPATTDGGNYRFIHTRTIQRALAVLKALKSPGEPGAVPGAWMVTFEDRDFGTAVWTGPNAEGSARHAYSNASTTKACRLWRCVEQAGYGPPETKRDGE
jgi:hypothetical protein